MSVINAVSEPLDNPGVGPRLTSKSLAASWMPKLLAEVFQSLLSGIAMRESPMEPYKDGDRMAMPTRTMIGKVYR
ncbi:MAG: hypothetical protein ACKN89_09780 [Cyanobium sp.]|jgi:hypothetical protein